MGNLGDLSPHGSVAVGVVVGLISTSLQAIGLTLQRKSHILEDEKTPYDLRRPPYKRRRWQLGMLMFVVANIVGSTIQITTLPLPVLSTLQASGLVFNTIFSTLILGEPFTKYSLIGTLLVCIGAILIATFGAIGEPAHSLDQLLELLQRRAFILWMVGTGVLVLVILLGSRTLKLLLSPSRPKCSNSLLVPHSPRTPITPIVHSRVKLIRGMSYGLISGILSAHSLLLAKSAVELLVRTIVDRSNQFNRWQSWMILMGMIILALTQLFYLHRGLKLCSTSVLYPFVFCIYNIIAIMDGLIYFRQVSQLDGFRAGLIALGTVVLLSGVLCLSCRLEDVESHSGIAVVGPSQTSLGTGMGIVEEHSQTACASGADGDEESQVGECEPLLHTINARRKNRAPSLPLLTSPCHPHRTSTSDVDVDVDPASIWAELDDSDYEFDPRASESHADHIQGRPRSKSGSFPVTSNGRHQTNRDLDTHYYYYYPPTQGQSEPCPPRGNQTCTPSDWRRVQSRRRRSGLWRSNNEAGNNQEGSLVGYGSTLVHNQHVDEDDQHQNSVVLSDPASSPVLAGSRAGMSMRSTMATAWERGIGFLQQWTGQRS